MLKKPASGVLAIAHRLSVQDRVRFTSPLAAALLDDLFEHPAWLCVVC
jgi:hypothetical protein